VLNVVQRDDRSGMANEYRAKVVEQYNAALKAQPEDLGILQAASDFYLRDRQLTRATPYLEQIIRLGSNKALPQQQQADNARRALAMVWSSVGSYPEATEALRVLNDMKQGSASASDVSKNKRARAVVLAVQRNRKQQREAIGILEAVRLEQQGLS